MEKYEFKVIWQGPQTEAEKAQAKLIEELLNSESLDIAINQVKNHLIQKHENETN